MGLQKEQPQKGFRHQEDKPPGVLGNQLYEEKLPSVWRGANEERDDECGIAVYKLYTVKRRERIYFLIQKEYVAAKG